MLNNNSLSFRSFYPAIFHVYTRAGRHPSLKKNIVTFGFMIKFRKENLIFHLNFLVDTTNIQ